MHVLTRHVGATVGLVDGSVVRVVASAPGSASVQVNEGEAAVIRVGRSHPVPGGELCVVDLLPPDRVRLGFTPEDLVARPREPGDGHPGRPVSPSRAARHIAVGALMLAAASIGTQLADTGCPYPLSVRDVALHVGTAGLAVVALVAGLLMPASPEGAPPSRARWLLSVAALVVLAMSAMLTFGDLWFVGCF